MQGENTLTFSGCRLWERALFGACQRCVTHHSAPWFAPQRCWAKRTASNRATGWGYKDFLVLHFSKPWHSRSRLQNRKLAVIQLELTALIPSTRSNPLHPPPPHRFFFCFWISLQQMSLFLLLQNLKKIWLSIVIVKVKVNKMHLVMFNSLFP